MTRAPIALSRTIGVIALAAAAAFSGCGSGNGDADTNGLERLSPRQVQQRAASELEAAKSMRMRGTIAGDGPGLVDLRFSGKSMKGSLTASGVTVEITRIGDAVYLKTDRRGLEQLGVAWVAKRFGADRWLKLGPDQITEWEGFSIAAIAGQLAADDAALESQVEQDTLAGHPVVVVRRRDGSRLYVANTGHPYPLRGDYKGADAGRVDFSEYDADFRITAPTDVIDIPALLERERGSEA